MWVTRSRSLGLVIRRFSNSACVYEWPFLVILWGGGGLVGSVHGFVSGPEYEVRRRLISFCAVVVMRLGVSCSSVDAWAYVIVRAGAYLGLGRLGSCLGR